MNRWSRRWSRIAPLGMSLALLGSGCHETRPDAKPTQSPPPPAAAAPAAEPTPPPPPERAEAACAAPIATGAAHTLTVGSRAATVNGAQLSFADKSPDGKLTLGVLGPINEDSGANLLALQKYIGFFAKEHASAIVVTGDVGESQASITRVLEKLASSKLPVLVVIGNRECQSDFTDGVAAAQAKNPNIINLDTTRVVSFPEATLVSLPGYHDPNFISCAKGCRYYKSTVDEVITTAKASKAPVVLVSHGPPHGQGSQALDYAPNAGGNVGDPDVLRALRDGNIHFGLFSNIKEAGARATDAEGSTVIQPGTEAPALYLNPGPASTDDWKMNDGTVSHGFAATLTIDAQGGKWKPYRNAALTAAEKRQAKTLEPKHGEEDSGEGKKPKAGAGG